MGVFKELIDGIFKHQKHYDEKEFSKAKKPEDRINVKEENEIEEQFLKIKADEEKRRNELERIVGEERIKTQEEEEEVVKDHFETAVSAAYRHHAMPPLGEPESSNQQYLQQHFSHEGEHAHHYNRHQRETYQQ